MNENNINIFKRLNDIIDNYIEKIKDVTYFDEIIALLKNYKKTKNIIKDACNNKVINFEINDTTNLVDIKALLSLILFYESVDIIFEKKLKLNNNDYEPYFIFDSCLKIVENKIDKNILYENYNGLFNKNDLPLKNIDNIINIICNLYKLIICGKMDQFTKLFTQSYIENSLISNFCVERIALIKQHYLELAYSSDDIDEENKIKIILYNNKILLFLFLHKINNFIKNTIKIAKTYPKTSLGVMAGFTGASILSTEWYQDLIAQFLEQHPLSNTIIGPILRNPKSSIFLGSLATYLISKGYPQLAKLWNEFKAKKIENIEQEKKILEEK